MIPLFITLTVAGRDTPTDVNVSKIAHIAEAKDIDRHMGSTAVRFDDGSVGHYKESVTEVRALINAQTQDFLEQVARSLHWLGK